MAELSRLPLPPDLEACRARLEKDLLNTEAAAQLKAAAAAARQGQPALAAVLREVCGVLDGGEGWMSPEAADKPPRRIDDATHEVLLIHPREKQERRHQLTSLLGRVLHLLEGNEAARTITRVTEKATVEGFPQLCRITDECARALGVDAPAIHIARGEEPFFTALLDRSPFLCIHRDFASEAHVPSEGFCSQCLAPAEMRFAIGHHLEHVKGGHVALLQISPELLEQLVLDQLPFLVRTPVRAAVKAVGLTRANVAVKKVGEWLPGQSRTQRVVAAVGELLPDRDQETVLPDVVHEWLRRWIQGVEFSADRAGLLLSGSVGASCAAMLRLSPASAQQLSALRQRGLRRYLQESAPSDRATSDRLKELLRFALGREYLGFVAASGAA